VKFIALEKVAKIDRTVASGEECNKLPYVGLEHIEKETGHFIDGFEPKPENLLATKFRFTTEHVLYGKLRPYLNKTTLPKFNGVCTTEILPILPDVHKLNRTYLWGIFLTPKFVDWASRSVSGANLPRLDPKLLAKYEIPLPPLPEQERIATLLDKADRLRRLRHYVLQLGDSYLQSIFLEMFGDPVTNPMGWEKRTLKSIGTKFSYGTNAKCDYEEKGFPVLRIPNVLSGKLDLSDLKYSELPEKEIEQLRLHKCDVIFVRTNGNPDYVGRCAVYNLDIDFMFASYLIRARVNREIVLPLYLNTYLHLPAGRMAMFPFIRTTAGQSNIGMEGLGQIPVPLPPIAQQEKFTQIVQRYERLRSQQRESLRQAEHLFESLLAKSFSDGSLEFDGGV
jgi:type I restriction enzyme, S subunit